MLEFTVCLVIVYRKKGIEWLRFGYECVKEWGRIKKMRFRRKKKRHLRGCLEVDLYHFLRRLCENSRLLVAEQSDS